MGVAGIKFKVISKDEFQLDLNYLGLSKKALLSHPRRNEMLLFLLPRAVSLPLHSARLSASSAARDSLQLLSRLLLILSGNSSLSGLTRDGTPMRDRKSYAVNREVI